MSEPEVIDFNDPDTEYLIMKDDKPVAVLVPYERYESLVETLDIVTDEDTMRAIREGETRG